MRWGEPMPKRSSTSASVARWIPGGKSPLAVNGGRDTSAPRRYRGSGTKHQEPEPRDLARLLRVGGVRCREQAQNEHDDTSDGAVPHARLLTSAACQLASCHGSRTPRLSCCQERATE